MLNNTFDLYARIKTKDGEGGYTETFDLKSSSVPCYWQPSTSEGTQDLLSTTEAQLDRVFFHDASVWASLKFSDIVVVNNRWLRIKGYKNLCGLGKTFMIQLEEEVETTKEQNGG